MKKFVGLRAKTNSYLTEDGCEDGKAKRTTKCVIKIKLKFEDYKNCSVATRLENRIIQESQIWKNNVQVHSLRENHKDLDFVKTKN